MKDRLHEFNNKAVAVCDSVIFEDEDYPVSVDKDHGVLSNDFDFDGNEMIALSINTTVNGNLELYNDGSFSYMPFVGFNGRDSFEYCIYDGYSLSVSNKVYLLVEGNNGSGNDDLHLSRLLNVFPNPASDFVTVSSSVEITNIMLFSISGKLLKSIPINSKTKEIDVGFLSSGNYFISAILKDKTITERLIIK